MIDEIISIEEVESGDTIDIEVSGDHLFFANDILTHNSQLSRGNLLVSIEDLTEGFMADSWRKVSISDLIVGMAATPEERAANRINFKTLKSRNGIKDEIFPLKIEYEKMTISDLAKKG
jgi:hypothetical protein